MNHPHTTTTAVEKLKRAAKAHRDSTGCSLAVALEHVALQAGYANWKQVTQSAALSAGQRNLLLPANHRARLTYVMAKGQTQLKRVSSVTELCEALGGVEPVLIRSSCGEASVSYPCLCQLDPFATAMQANVAFDLGDKYDTWDYLFDANKPAREFPSWQMRATFRLATDDHYPNEHLATRRNRDRSNALNPNNSARAAATDNRSNQLNPNNSRYRN